MQKPQINLNDYPISKDRETEVVGVIQGLVDIAKHDFKEYQESKKGFYGLGSYIIDFFTLPKTDLHKEFEECIIKPLREANQEIIEMKLKNTFKRLREEVKYQDQGDFEILRKYKLESGTKVITIGVPYYDNSAKKTRFKHTQNIYSNESPKFYEFIRDNLSFYKN